MRFSVKALEMFPLLQFVAIMRKKRNFTKDWKKIVPKEKDTSKLNTYFCGQLTVTHSTLVEWIHVRVEFYMDAFQTTAKKTIFLREFVSLLLFSLTRFQSLSLFFSVSLSLSLSLFLSLFLELYVSVSSFIAIGEKFIILAYVHHTALNWNANTGVNKVT